MKPNHRFADRAHFGGWRRGRDALVPFAARAALLFFTFAGSAWLAPSAHAQAPVARVAAPRIGYVYPAGGRQGTTTTVTVGGQFLGDVSGASFFGDGIAARVLGAQRPLTQKELETFKEEGQALREKFNASRRKSGEAAVVWTSEDERRAAELRRLAGYRMARQTAPAICEAVTLEVTIAADATAGEREIRLRAPNGLSNPLAFHVGALAEFSELAAFPNTAAPEDYAGTAAAGGAAPKPKAVSPERTVELPCIANGQVLPGETDRWKFAAKRGQRLVVLVQARALIPYLADAVPGWFQATVALFDARGRELAYADDFRFSPDPVLSFTIPADGEYRIEIKDSIYRGRQDFVYRVALGELPFVTGMFPLGGRAGRATPVTFTGWNLPAAPAPGATDADAPPSFPGAATLRTDDAAFATDGDPGIGEAVRNDSAEQAQLLSLPAIVNGRIERTGDEDWFALRGKSGEPVVVEVWARRLDSPLDSLLTAFDTGGNELARNDDHEDKGAGLTTHHADSRLQLGFPAGGEIRVRLTDTQRQGGGEFAYRLHAHAPRPDFALRVAPASLSVRPGAHVPVTVFALRRDGFAGPIELALREGDGPFEVSGATIPAGEDKVRLTLTTLAAPRDETFHPQFVGRAAIAGKPVVHTAVPCEDLMQAFAYRHLVPAKTLEVAVIGRGAGPRTAMRVEGKSPLRLASGATASVRVGVPAAKFFENVKAELSEPPDGVSLVRSVWRGETVELVFTIDAAKAKPGACGNLLVQLTGERPGAAKPDKDGKKPNRARIPLTLLPAIPYEIAVPPPVEGVVLARP